MPGPEVFDVVIFGASGFTGKYVIREALKFLSPNASPLRTLLLAGRNRERVAAALSWAASPGPVPDVPILVADASDPASLATVAARARVLLSCAGPFRLHGRQVAAACAEAGAHCLDISGEPEFMERVEADLHEVAAKNGSLIVSACGFASTVADLGFLFHSRQWTPPSAPASVVAYVNLESSDRKIVGNFTTFESAVLGVANTSQLQVLRRSRPRPAKPSIPGPPPPKGSLMIEHDKALGLWAMKLPSADTVVVKRTLAKVTEHPEGLPCADETSDFEKHRKEFWSSIKPAHFGVKIGSRSILGLVWCLSTAIFVGILAGFSFGRSLLLKFPEFFSLGFFRKTGPTEAEVSSASFKTWFVGRGYINSRHASECSPDKEIVTRVSGPEIGYITTSIILIQCALVLLSQRANLPKGGVYTPGVVFGPTDLQKRLEENGLSFDLISTRTIPSDEQAHAS